MAAKRNEHIKFFFFLFALFITHYSLFSQTPKGLIVTDKEAVTTGKTRALIVGISKYELIDTLQYADRDAQVFADYLRKNKFWGIDKDDVTLLVNDKAKYGDLTVQLQRIAMVSKPGDNLLFYFSGHGDVEIRTMFNRGYLLAYDTNPINYMANGLRVDDLKDIFVTLLTNNVKVIIVTDACRSGKLAGGLKGVEFTAAAISSMWMNEIKILSSQPGQLSYEDKKWGNGRGVFSYYLINGLNGEADANKDSSITLSELEMYVGSNVTRETGNKQQPIFEGPNKFSTIIAKITPQPAKTNGKTGGNNISQLFSSINLPDDSCFFYYDKMDAAIKEKRLGSADPNSASSFYKKLRSCAKGDDIQFKANGELLSALMNESQEIINNSFVGKKLVSEDDFNNGIDLLQQVLDNNDLKLPYEKHIRNLKRYLEVQGTTTWQSDVQTDKLELIIDSAIKEEPDAAYLYTAKGSIEMEKGNWTKAIQLLEQSLGNSPGWLVPKYYLGVCYGKKKNYQKALSYLEDVLQKDTLYRTFECTKCILTNMAEIALKLKQDQKAINYYLKTIDLFPDFYTPYIELDSYLEDNDKADTSIANEFINRLYRVNDTVFYRLMRIRLEWEFKERLVLAPLDSVRVLLKDNIDSADYYSTLAIYFKDEMYSSAANTLGYLKSGSDGTEHIDWKKTETIRWDDPRTMNKLTDDEKLFVKKDSALFYYKKAVELDTTDAYYMQNLIFFLSGFGEDEDIQQILPAKLKYYPDEEKASLKVLLADSYLRNKKMKEAFKLYAEANAAGAITCKEIKEMKKDFKSLPEYLDFIHTCRDD